MATEELAIEVATAFKSIANASLDKPLLDKCMNLCKTSGIDAESLATQWEAFALNNNYDAPTQQHLEKLGDILIRKSKNNSKCSTPTLTPGIKQRYGVNRGSALKARTPGSGSRTTPVKGSGVFQEAFGVKLSNKAIPTTPPHRASGSVSGYSTGNRRIRAVAPGTQPNKIARTGSASSPLSMGSGGSPHAAMTPSEKYAKRTNMGKIEFSFNKHLPHATPAQLPNGINKEDELTLGRPDRCVVTTLDTPAAGDGKSSADEMLYMYTTLEGKGHELNAQLEEAREEFARRLGVEEFDKIGEKSPDEVLVCGRICCESEGKLNDKSLVLEGSLKDNGRRVSLNVSGLSAFSFFPGQIVAVRGVCFQSDVLMARKVYTDLSLPRMKTSTAKLRHYAEQMELAKPESVRTPPPLSVIVAAGPYTLNDNLEFEPFEDLLSNLADESEQRVSADVLVLMGPFVDSKHPFISSGKPIREFEGDNGEVIPVTLTFEEVYEIFFDRLAKAIETLPSLTKVVLVPSLDDVSHRPCFPQPALSKGLLRSLPNLEKVVLLPNPGTFQVNEIVFGVTTQDIVFNLSQEDTSFQKAGVPREDRMTRLVGHMIKQHSYYPVFPPATNAHVDYTLRQKYEFPVTPDVMLCFSKLSPFVRKVEDVLAVNPGKLSKGAMGGLFARISVHGLKTPNKSLMVSSQSSQESATSEGDEEVYHQVVQRSRVDLVRV